MLVTWKLTNFKSVRDPVELELAPLTVFAGANSSGKSTVLQSMLLAAQTLQSPVVTRPVILNGHVVRLGAFTDIVANADETAVIQIGFQLRFEPPEERRARLAMTGLRYTALRRGRPAATTVDCSFSFSMHGDPEERDLLRMQPRLEHSYLRVATASEGQPRVEEVEIRRSKEPVHERVGRLQLPESAVDEPEASSLEYELVRLNPFSSRRGGEELVDRKNAGASLQHFLPVRATVTYQVLESEIEQIIKALTEPTASAWSELELEESAELNEAVRRIILEAIERARFNLLEHQVNARFDRLPSLRSDKTLNDLSRSLRRLPPRLQVAIAQEITGREEELRTAIRANRRSRRGLRFVQLPDGLMTGHLLVHHYFSTDMKYLGPLRDEPKPVYPLGGAATPSDVGFRGEHTAAVLDTHRNSTVEYIPTLRFSEDVGPGAREKCRLLPAVLDWLEYMGVGTELSTADQGKLGHELKIAVPGSTRLHELTHVGVGVSQVLPILVLSLIAERGSTLIFEQPELHLHPRVQTRLADFFVALTQLGKQCIVETHSEYLINRLRFRAARSRGKEVSDSVILYFVDKRGEQSHYRPIRINELGVIEEWPQGFFDEAEENAAALLRAGIEKRRKRELHR